MAVIGVAVVVTAPVADDGSRIAAGVTMVIVGLVGGVALYFSLVG